MRFLLPVLAFAFALLSPLPVLAQTSQAGPSDAQYDGDNPGGGTARSAVLAALLASGALQNTAEEDQATQGDSASAAESSASPSERDAASSIEARGESSVTAEARGESSVTAGAQGESSVTAGAQGESSITTEAQAESVNTSDLEKLPQTGGPSPLWLFGAPLICICGVLSRRIVLP
jgi:hypothetical protein